MKKIYFLLCVFAMLVQTVGAVTKEEADQAYEQNKFPEAIQLYEALLSEQGESADVYYNLGNAYFKDKNTATRVVASRTGERNEKIDAFFFFDANFSAIIDFRFRIKRF